MNEGRKLRDESFVMISATMFNRNVVSLTDLNISITLSGHITSSHGQVEPVEIDVISDSSYLTFYFSVFMTRILSEITDHSSKNPPTTDFIPSASSFLDSHSSFVLGEPLSCSSPRPDVGCTAAHIGRCTSDRVSDKLQLDVAVLRLLLLLSVVWQE